MTDTKTILVFILLFAVLAVAYVLFANQEKEVDPQLFLSSLKNSSSVYIVQDIRGANDEIRRNILQCGVDLAGSQGLASLNKNVTIYAFDDSKCTTINGENPLSECEDYKNAPTFYIMNGVGNHFYENKLIIGIGENYTVKSCDVKTS